QIVRPLQIDRVDVRIGRELLERDHARRLHTDLLQILLLDDDVASLVELEALDDVGVRDFALALWTPALLLNARLAFAVELVEAERRGGVGRGKHFDGNVDEADLEIALPRRP